MNNLYDMHCHILPGVDDGAKDMDMTLQMIAEEYGQGVRIIIATPHYYPGHKSASPEQLKAAYDAVKKEINEKYKDLSFYLGNEIYYKDSIIEDLKEKKVYTLAETRYILVEFNTQIEYKEIYRAIQKCVNAGYYPIIAHVERYQSLYKKENLLRELIQAGAYIQMNGENFQGGLFNSNRSYCLKLIQSGLVHFIGTDCHNMDSRKPNLEMAEQMISKKAGADRAEQLLHQNPDRLLEGKCI